jgi:hypothetical protein
MIIVAASVITGIFFIGLNVYLRRTAAESSIAYTLLGLVVIAAGSYTALLHREKDKLQSAHSHLQGEYKALKRQSTYQRKVPRICDTSDEHTLPPLRAEQLYIMQQLFWGSYRIHVKPLEGGFSNFGVFHVVEETADHNLLQPGKVVKYLSFEDIRKEKAVHEANGVLKEHPLAYTPGRPIGNWPPDHQLGMAKGRLGAISYELATLQSGGQLNTLNSLYKHLSSQEIISYMQLLLGKLERWYSLRLPVSVGSPLGGANGTYERLYRRRRDIQNGIIQLIKSANPSSSTVLSQDELDTEPTIALPFLPEDRLREKFSNPVYWINTVLAPGRASCFRARSPYSPVHGDLHTGNVLIEQRSETLIWLIDFPNAHIGPSLKDFATLEADIKFNLIDMERCSLDDWLRFEEQLLSPLRSPYLALDSPWFQSWKPVAEDLLKAWEFIGFLRRWVRENQLIGADVRAYYLALLHATLPIVYRYSHTEIQKQCALTSSTWMCEHLSS